MAPGRTLLFNRRSLLKGVLGAGLAAGSFSGPGIVPARAQFAQFKSDPFSLGVASGDPSPDGFVLWTRLAPQPLMARGGMHAVPIEVTYEIARDSEMKQMVRTGQAVARIELVHSVHVEVDGLEPEREYFYRFRAGNAESQIGRTRTLPAFGAEIAQLRFANAGCQQWESGYYTAWRRIAEENLDFVFHYGDYIYELGRQIADPQGRPHPRVMPTEFATCFSLSDYRRRYGLYKSDLDLQAAHASCPFLPSFDDHEVVDNWANETDSKNTPAEAFLIRRAAGFQAWYEHMPVRRSAMPRGPDMKAYRHFGFGKLLDFAVLDTRQFRSKQPCSEGHGVRPACPEAADPNRTMLGETQERWLADRLRGGSGTWQVLGQQTAFSHFDWRSFPWVKTAEPAVKLDAWDGAPAARSRMLDLFRDAKVANPVVLTGDLHMGLAFNIGKDGRDPSSQPIAAEFLATSISSAGDGWVQPENETALRTNNPHLRFIGGERGYTRHTVTRKSWQADFRVVEKVSTPNAPVATRKSLVVEAGKPGLAEA
jgi:alkaline phosphatase D